MPSLAQELQELVSGVATYLRRVMIGREVRFNSYTDLIGQDFSPIGVGSSVWAAGYKYIVLDPSTALFDHDTNHRRY
jgi:hypothetical protein